MRLPLGLLVQTSLILILLYTAIFFGVNSHLNAHDGKEITLKRVSKKLEQKEFELKVSRINIEKIKNEFLYIAEKEFNIDSPKISSKLAKYNLLGTLRGPASVSEKIDFTPLNLEKVKTHFREKKYYKVIELAEKEINRSQNSIVLPEIYFFLNESYFLTQQFEKSIDTIEKMLSLFPEHIMTGYAMIRLAQVSEKTDQSEEAVSVYNIILNHFNDPKLVSEVSRLKEKIIN